MKETVHQPKQPWLVAIAVVGIAGVFFYLMGTSKYPEPGANIVYDIQEFEDLDKIETPFEEVGQVEPGIEDLQALAVGGDTWYVAGKGAVAAYGTDDRELGRYEIPGTANCLAVAPDGTLFVGLAKKVCVLDRNGTPQGEWTDFTPRSYLTSIAATDTDVFVADAGKRVVYRFDRQGKLLGRIGEKDPKRDIPGLEVPSPYLDVALNEEGHLWVANPGKLGLEQFRADGSLVTSWYRPSLKLEGFPGCCNPVHIAFGSGGRLFTGEKGLVRLKMYEVTSGEFEGLVTGSQSFPRQPSIRDLAVDARARILVLDHLGEAVRMFALKETDDGNTRQPI
jgi:hypothetical protein